MFQDYYGDRAPEALAKEFGPIRVALEKLNPDRGRGRSNRVMAGTWCLSTPYSRAHPCFRGDGAGREDRLARRPEEQAWLKAYTEMRAKYILLFAWSFDKEALKRRFSSKKQVPAPSGEGPL